MIHHHSSGKRRLWKRIFSMCIALILICGMTVPASSVSASSITDGVSEEAVTPDGKTALNETASGETETVSGTTEMEASESKTDDSATQPDETTPEGTDGSETDNSETNDSGETVPTATVTYTFYVDGEAYNTQTLKDGETLTAPADPEADGKTFDGWYTAETDGEKFTAFGVQTVTETKTVDLYAGWLTDAGSESDDTPESTEEIPGEETGGNSQLADTAGEQDQNGNGENEGEIPSADANGFTGVTENANDGTSTMAVSNREMRVGEEITLSGTSNVLVGRITKHAWSWSSNNGGNIDLNGRDSQATVRAVSAGTVTVTHSYTVKYLFGGSQTFNDTWTIAITDSLDEGTYQIYIYTVVPGKEGDYDVGEPNDNWNGMGIGTISDVEDPQIYKNQLTDTNARVFIYRGDSTIQGHIENGKIGLPTSFPSITVDGREYQYATTPEQETAEGYYTIQWIRVVVSGGANTGKNNYNQPEVRPEIPTYHLDGIVILNQENRYTVNFALKDVNDEDFVILENYSTIVAAGYEAKRLTRPEINDSNTYPPEKEENGITYKFDGWYTDETCTERVNWETEVIRGNTTYYAKYIPATQNVTVEKKITGGLGDLQKKFKFEYSYTTTSGTVSEVVKDPIGNGDEFVIENIPVGVTLTLKETGAAGYTTSASYNNEEPSYALEGENSDSKTMRIKITDDISTIEVVNNKEAKPDTGIHLTNWPYVMTLAFAGLGAVTFGLYKYRRRNS